MTERGVLPPRKRSGSDLERFAQFPSERMARLVAVTTALARAILPSQVASVLVDEAAAALDADGASLVLLDEDGQSLETVGISGYPDGVFDRWRHFSIDQPTLVARAFQCAEPVFAESADAMARLSPEAAAVRTALGHQAWAAVPLITQGRVFGCLALSFSRPREFTEDDRDFMVVLAGQCAQALERARLNEIERQALAEAEAAHASADILESITEAFFALDGEWRFTYVNRHAEWFLLHSRSELLGKNFCDVIPGVAGTIFELECRNAIGREQPTTFEAFHEPSNTWFEVHAYPAPRGLSVFFHEIGERKRMEQAISFLADATAQLSSSLDYETTLTNVAHLAVPALADWCTVDVLNESGAIERLAVAYPDGESADKADVLRRHPPDPAGPSPIVQVIKSGRTKLYADLPREALVHRDDEHREVLEQLGFRSGIFVPIVAHNRTLGVITLLSTTSRRRYGPPELLLAEGLASRAALAIQNARQFDAVAVERNTLTAILDSMSQAVFRIDLMGRVVRVNEVTCQLVEMPAQDIIGRKAHDVFRWEDESGRLLDEDEYMFWQAFGTGENREMKDRFLRKSNGKRIPVSISATPIVDGQRRIIGAVEVVRDISREREAEELKNQIISLVSHELRTPIGHIKGFASSLLEPDIDWEPDTQHDFIVEIDREADRLAALVSDLLDMSRIESRGADMLEASPVRLASIVRQAIEATAKATAEHSIVNLVAEDLPEILVDASQVERVVGNLLENAAKYSEPGTEITVGAGLEDGQFICSVSDRGPGIPDEFRDRIFEKFFRIKTGRPRTPGTGLGLPICRGIVEAHGGRIWLDTKLGQGSSFSFTLPLAPPGTGRAAARSAKNPG